MAKYAGIVLAAVMIVSFAGYADAQYMAYRLPPGLSRSPEVNNYLSADTIICCKSAVPALGHVEGMPHDHLQPLHDRLHRLGRTSSSRAAGIRAARPTEIRQSESIRGALTGGHTAAAIIGRSCSSRPAPGRQSLLDLPLEHSLQAGPARIVILL